MKAYSFLFGLCILSSVAGAQEISYSHLPPGVVTNETTPTGDYDGERSGSCASPDGPIIGGTLTGYPPSYNWLNNHGHCYTIPTTKNATWCWTFTSPGTAVTLDCGFSVSTCAGAWSYWFDGFTLYTCAPSCTLVGSGLSFTGLTPGACYTWCFNTNFTGCGAAYGFTSLCPYVIDNTPLPIELSAFSCEPKEGSVQLNWTTENEMNCMEFGIMRSADGINFEKIGHVNGNGTTDLEHQYIFSDVAPVSGINYYRLEPTDYNQRFSLSDIVFCIYDDQVIETNYYDMTGSKVDPDRAPAGIYIKENVYAGKRVREIFYKRN